MSWLYQPLLPGAGRQQSGGGGGGTDYNLAALAGTIDLDGQDALFDLEMNFTVNADPGVVAIAGQTATFRLSGAASGGGHMRLSIGLSLKL